MTTVKHNLSTFNSVDNPILGAMLELNAATSGLWVYTLLFMIFFITSWVFIKRTNDIAKSLIQSTHILMILSLLLYFAGKSIGTAIISDAFMLLILSVEALALGGIYFMRTNKNE